MICNLGSEIFQIEKPTILFMFELIAILPGHFSYFSTQKFKTAKNEI